MATPDRNSLNAATVREQLIAQARLKLSALAQQKVVPPETVEEFNAIRFDRKYAPVKVEDILEAVITQNVGSIIFLIHERLEGPTSRSIALGERGGRNQKPVMR